MKTMLFCSIGLLASLVCHAQDCPPARYRQLIGEADRAAREGKYDLAINKLQSAKTCQPDSEAVVNKRVVEVFREVNRQRELAIENEREAVMQRNKSDKAARSSFNAALALRLQKIDATLAVRIADYNYQKHPDDPLARSTFYELLADEKYGLFEKQFQVCSDTIVDIKLEYNGYRTCVLTKTKISFLDSDNKIVFSEKFKPGTNVFWADNGSFAYVNENSVIEIRDSSFRPVPVLKDFKLKNILDYSPDGKSLLIRPIERAIDKPETAMQETSGNTGFDYPSAQLIDIYSNNPDSNIITFYDENLNGWFYGRFFYPEKDSLLVALSRLNEVCSFNLSGDPIKCFDASGGDFPLFSSLNGQNFIAIAYNKFSLINYGSVEVYSYGEKIKYRHFKEHVNKILFVPGKGQVLILSGGNLHLWDIYRESVAVFQNVSCFDVSFDGQYLFTSNNSGYIKKWYLPRYIIAHRNLNSRERQVGINNDGMCMTNNNLGEISFTDNAGNRSVLFSNKRELKKLLFLSDNLRVIALTRDSFVEFLNLQGEVIYQQKFNEKISNIDVSPDGSRLWVTLKKYTQVFDIHDDKMVEVKLPGKVIGEIVFSGDSRFFAATLEDNVVALLSKNGQLLQRFPTAIGVEYSEIEPVIFAPDYKSVVVQYSGVEDGYARISTDNQITTFEKTPGETLKGNGKFVVEYNYYANSLILYDFDLKELATIPIGGVGNIIWDKKNNFFTAFDDDGYHLIFTPDAFLNQKVAKISLADLFHANTSLEPDDLKTIQNKRLDPK